MKRQLALGLITALIGLASCEDDVSSPMETNETDTASATSTSHLISKEDALNSLYDFLSEQTENGLKAISVIDTAEMWSVGSNAGAGTNKSLQNASQNDALVYVVNFTNENGYAILAADDRINEEVLAISDSGNLPKSAAATAMDAIEEERSIYEEYPLTGDGFFSVSEYPDEIFMNPNTVSLYDEDEDDTLVGNFSTDNIGEEDEDGNLVESANKSIQTQAEDPNIGLGLCLTYAKKRVLLTPDNLDDGSGSAAPSTKTEKSYTDWEDTGKKSKKLLETFTSWNQHSPFNDQYPRRRRFRIFGHKRKVPAGCFPLAIAKIMTALSTPTNLYFNGYKIDWSSLNKGYLTSEGRISAATLVYGISVRCKSWYFYAGTFTFPHRAIDFMEEVGFKNVKKYDYNFSRIKKMIDDGKPVIIMAMPKLKVTKSHAWNIDGYKTKTRTITTNTYSGTNLTKSETITETREMVHCDFGWEGNSNGYYVSGIFDLDSGENEYDKGYSEKSDNYNRFIKIITYDK